MNDSDVANAELALCITLEKSVLNLKKGRLKNLLRRLSKESEKQIRKLPAPSTSAMEEIRVALDKFAESTGWSKKQKHLQTYVAAISLIIEKRGYKRINSILVDINDYQERYKKIQPSCYWSAEIVEQKWVDAFYSEKEKGIDYALFDNRMQSKDLKFPFAKKQGYEFWSEMIEDLHINKEMSPTDIVNHILNCGYPGKISIESVRGTLNTMNIYIKRGKKVLTKVKKKVVKSKLVNPCRRFGVREIPPENWRFCSKCRADNCKVSNVHEEYTGATPYIGRL